MESDRACGARGAVSANPDWIADVKEAESPICYRDGTDAAADRFLNSSYLTLNFALGILSH